MDIKVIKVGICNCYIVKDEETIVIDAGMPGNCDLFSKGLQKIGVTPTDIKAIIVTHCHWDHIGCANKIKELTGAKVIVNKNEKDILEQGKISMPPGVTRWGKIFGPLVKGLSTKHTIEPTKVDITLGEENYSLEEFGIKGKVIFTPGHSLGSSSVVLDSGEAFVGDAAMNGLPLTIKPNLPIFAEDMVALKNSWKKLIDMGVKRVYPAHGKSFPIEKIEKLLS